MQVELLKKAVSYVDEQTGEERTGTRFYLRCGGALIPIDVSYFPDKQTGKDPRYSSRKEVVKAFASELPDKVTAVKEEKS